MKKDYQPKVTSLSYLIRSSRGVFLATGLIFLTPIIGMAILATDMGMAHLVRTEASNSADLVALAAIKKFGKVSGQINAESMASIRRTAELVAEANRTRMHSSLDVDTATYTGGMETADADVIFGFYDHTARDFSAQTDVNILSDTTANPTNAIMARLRMGNGSNDPFVFYLTRWFDPANADMDHMNLEVRGFASFGYVNVNLASDISNSMDNRTYMTIDNCTLLAPWNEDTSRWFHNAASANFGPTCFNDSSLRVIGGSLSALPDEGAVMPEPITSVFKSMINFYETNQLFRGLYRTGLVVFETEGYTPYHLGDSVRLDYTKLGNKDDVIEALEYTIEEMRRYAVENDNGDPVPFEEHTAAPGGANPEVTGGFTNTGDGLFWAINDIIEANAETRVRSSDHTLLFSDGRANCFRVPIDNPRAAIAAGGQPFCPREDDVRASIQADFNQRLTDLQADGSLSAEDLDDLRNYRETLIDDEMQSYNDLGAAWAFSNAELAADNNIKIHAVYFDTNNEDCAASPPGFLQVQQIASMTDGVSACAEDIEELDDFFTNIATTQSFVLVNPEDILEDAGSQ